MNMRKLIASFVLAFALLPVAFASTEFKGTETVNINKANAATLAAYLKGIGPNKADAIVKYRKANGSFKSLEDLKNVPGIGDETFKGVRKSISTSRGKTVAPEGFKMGETSGKPKSTKKRKKAKSSENDSGSSNLRRKSSESTERSSRKKKSTSSDSISSSARRTSSPSGLRRSENSGSSSTKKKVVKQTKKAKKDKKKKKKASAN